MTVTGFVDNVVPMVTMALACAFLFGAAWVALRNGRLYSVLLAALGAYGVFFVATLDSLQLDFSPTACTEAAFVYFVGVVTLLTTIGIAEDQLRPMAKTSLNSWGAKAELGAPAHLAWASVASLVSLVLFLLGRQDFDASWSEERVDAGFLSVVATFLFMIAMPGIGSALLSRRRFAAVVLLSINLLSFALSGSRAAILTLFGALGWILVARTRTGRSRLLLLIAIALAVTSAHVLLRFIRGFGIVPLLDVVANGSFIELFSASPASDDLSGGEAAIAKYFVLAVSSSASDAYGFGTSMFRLLLLPVASSWLPSGKPMDVTYQLWATAFTSGLFDGAEGLAILQDSFIAGSYGSVHATMFGEYFLSGRWPALVLSCLVAGLLSVAVDRLVASLSAVSALLVLGPVVVGFLMIARGNSVIGFGYFFYIVTFIVLCEQVGRFLIKEFWRSAPRSKEKGIRGVSA